MAELDAPYALSGQSAESFRRDGFVRLSGVLSPGTLETYGEAVDAAVEESRRQQPEWRERSTYQRAFVQVTNLWRNHPRVRDLVFSERLARLAAELLRTSGVRLYHDQALYKEPAEDSTGGHTPWHADQYYWPLATDRTVTAWIPLHDVPLAMGPLEFARASQRFTAGRDLAISDESEGTLSDTLEAEGFDHVCEPYAAGDVSFHRGWTFHRAGANRTRHTRRVMTVIYMADGCTVAEPTSDAQQLDLATWLPGLRPGDAAASALNPLLWTRSTQSRQAQSSQAQSS